MEDLGDRRSPDPVDGIGEPPVRIGGDREAIRRNTVTRSSDVGDDGFR